MLKQFLMKKMLQKQLQGVPAAEQEKIFAAIEKNPEFFQQIAKEMQDKMKSEGKDQMAAAMEVMQKHQAKLQEIMQSK